MSQRRLHEYDTPAYIAWITPGSTDLLVKLENNLVWPYILEHHKISQ